MCRLAKDQTLGQRSSLEWHWCWGWEGLDNVRAIAVSRHNVEFWLHSSCVVLEWVNNQSRIKLMHQRIIHLRSFRVCEQGWQTLSRGFWHSPSACMHRLNTPAPRYARTAIVVCEMLARTFLDRQPYFGPEQSSEYPFDYIGSAWTAWKLKRRYHGVDECSDSSQAFRYFYSHVTCNFVSNVV